MGPRLPASSKIGAHVAVDLLARHPRHERGIMSRASWALLGGGRSIGLPDNRDANGFSRLRVFADYANPPHADERVFSGHSAGLEWAFWCAVPHREFRQSKSRPEHTNGRFLATPT